MILINDSPFAMRRAKINLKGGKHQVNLYISLSVFPLSPRMHHASKFGGGCQNMEKKINRGGRDARLQTSAYSGVRYYTCDSLTEYMYTNSSEPIVFRYS
jgi:hypothetical protein